ncbi:FimV/HubP family polar landmark protein [Neptuniibacter pectenicola]|uniref:FimV/HubP family polar landmark protein n=1 Tax=Neptuniibacter pectenicola TaxID=1806669 RepID=UPI000832C122|nr:FimV/HubP family polar landmark protein [Neptuniibacter pectenicola]
MMLRKLAVSLAVAGIIGASNANALGLGEIKIHSALNEPLNAEIKLLQVRKLGPLQIQPRMADIDEFALAGLSKSRFLTDVSFQVKVNPDGTGMITMRSARPVKEPFLNFLVEVNWPNGRLVREYTLLLDPPVFDPTPVRKTVQPSASSKVSSSSAPSSSKPSTSNYRAADGKVRVGNNDTLWSIVIKHRPNESISAKKMMIALQKKNPHAFVDNNINGLRAGAVLTLPTLAEINKLNEKDAALEVVRQASQWKNKSMPAADVSTPAPIDESKKTVATEVVPEPPAPVPEDDKSAELKIVTPKESIEPEEGVATDQAKAEPETATDEAAPEGEESAVADETQALSERNEELEARLSESLENVDRITRENVELNERLDAIQYELEKLREMLELKDSELTTLQNKVVAAEAAPKPQPEKGFFDSPFMLGGIGAAIIAFLAGLFFFMRRRKEDDSDTPDESALMQVPEELSENAAVEPEAPAEPEPEPEAIVDELYIGDEADLLEDADLELGDTSDLDDLDDLDLDMDMDLDLEEDAAGDVLKTIEPDEKTDDLDDILEDDEFDLGLDDDLIGEDEAESLVAEDNEPDDLDDILGEVADEDESDALDDILGEVDDLEALDAEIDSATDDIDLELDDLDFEMEDDTGMADVSDDSDKAAAELNDDGLDFVVEPMTGSATEDDAADELNSLLDSVSDDDVDKLNDVAEQTEDDDLDAILGELDSDDAEEPTEEADASDADDVMAADIEAMLAANADPDDVPMEGLVDIDEPSDLTPEDDLEALLASAEADSDELGESELDDTESDQSDAASELDAMLGDLDLDLDAGDMAASAAVAGAGAAAAASLASDEEELVVEDDGLESEVADELEADLDSELEALLNSSDDIELEELAAEDEDVSADDDFDELAGLNLLEGADEVETKLDLARAYMDMDDLDGAKDILQEIVSEGNEQQKAEAEALITSINEK